MKMRGISSPDRWVYGDGPDIREGSNVPVSIRRDGVSAPTNTTLMQMYDDGETSSRWRVGVNRDGSKNILGKGYNQQYAPMSMPEPAPAAGGTMLLGGGASAPEIPRLMVNRDMRFGVPMSDDRRNQHLDYLQTKYDLNYMDAVGRERTMLLGKDEDRQNMVLGEMLQRTRPGSTDPKAGLMAVGGTGIWNANTRQWEVEPQEKAQAQPFEAYQGPTVYDEQSGMIGTYDVKTGSYSWRDRPKRMVSYGKEEFEPVPAEMPRYKRDGQPAAVAYQMSPEDQAAMKWAEANPDDPRAAAILKKLGLTK